MSESTFAERTSEILARVLAIAHSGGVAAEHRGNLLTMRFANGHRSTLTRQDSIEQVWLADGALTWQFESPDGDDDLQDAAGGGSMADVVTRMIDRHH